jgi:hypothetical protein
MKIFLSLDERSNMIKIYDQEMKSMGKFTPNKEKHNKKYPIINGFDYSELTMRLGLILSDETISAVLLSNYVSKSQLEF